MGMIDPRVTEYHRLRSTAGLPGAGPCWDWDDNVSPTVSIREIFRRSKKAVQKEIKTRDDKKAIRDRRWIREQISTNSAWHQSNWTMIVYREWLQGKPYDPERAHLYQKGSETNLPQAERIAA